MIHHTAVVILAAGLGTRMKSSRAKVLHEILGRPMILYVLEAAERIAGDNVVVVIGNQADRVREAVSPFYRASFALQREQLGTGHAVQCALPSIPGQTEHVLILCGDVPMIRYETIRWLVEDHTAKRRDVSLLTVDMEEPSGYGRVVFDENGTVHRIVEQADATDTEKTIRTVNTGIYCVRKSFLSDALTLLDRDNQQGELYLTDIVRIGHEKGKEVGALISSHFEEFIGINTQEDLQKVSILMGARGKSA